jgi:hypothetical protein
MSELAVITPTYRGDAHIFPELHRSVLEFTPDDTVHHVFVAARDKPLFNQYAGPRCRVWTHTEVLPARYLALPWSGLYVNARRPWPPVRGWIMQQTIKIAAAAQLDADVVLMADSDVVLVRPTRAARFTDGPRESLPGGHAHSHLRLFRLEGGVTDDMPRHVTWHQVARRLFGLPPAGPPPLTDYVTPLNFWDPAIVRAMQEHIRQTTGRHWVDVFNGELHISEFILYGVFVDHVLSAGGPLPAADTSTLHDYWERIPLDRDGALAFADKLDPAAVAMMISAKSNTPNDVRLAAIQRCAEVVAEQGQYNI